MTKETQAAELLKKLIQENEQNNFAGLKRTPEAIAHRKKHMDWSGSNPIVAGYSNEGDSPTAQAVEEHYIQGDISLQQAISVLLTLYDHH